MPLRSVSALYWAGNCAMQFNRVKGKASMQELIKIEYTNDNPTVLARDLHEALHVATPYNKWFPRMCEYGFAEGTDFLTVDKNVRRGDGCHFWQW